MDNVVDVAAPVGPAHLFNAALAILNGNVEVGRSLLRSNGVNVPILVSRLQDSVEMYRTRKQRELLRSLLMDTLRLQPPPMKDEDAAVWYAGVSAVESLLEGALNNL